LGWIEICRPLVAGAVLLAGILDPVLKLAISHRRTAALPPLKSL
jgi:hypothetical protein